MGFFLVHCGYIKGLEWWDYKAPNCCYLGCQILCLIKDHLKQIRLGLKRPTDVYSIKVVSLLLLVSESSVSDVIRSRATTPKFRFIAWLSIRDRLKTKISYWYYNIVLEIQNGSSSLVPTAQSPGKLSKRMKVSCQKINFYVGLYSVITVIYWVWRASTSNHELWCYQVHTIEYTVENIKHHIGAGEQHTIWKNIFPR